MSLLKKMKRMGMNWAGLAPALGGHALDGVETDLGSEDGPSGARLNCGRRGARLISIAECGVGIAE